MSELPIGIFDSGVGGLTVLRALINALPYEDTIYVGDTARVPYGTKSADTVIRYSQEIAGFLVRHNIRLLVVACNTASAVALPALRKMLTIPVVGVIEPGARRAVQVSRNGRIGVIGTSGTVRSNAYQQAIQRLNPAADVLSEPCPLFVPLAEEGWLDSQVTRLTAQTYLANLKTADIDTLVLGCTHYPLLKGVIAEIMGNGVTLVDSAEETARTVAAILQEQQLVATSHKNSRHRYFVTDVPEGFVRIGSHFLGDRLEQVTQVELDGIQEDNGGD